MSDGEAIHNRIHGEGHCDPPCGLCLEVQDLLDAYAHELAERQRAALWELYGDGPPYSAAEAYGMARASDLIDPEVTREH